jgi:histidinol-phosphatase
VNAEWRNRYEVAVALAQRAGQRALSYFAGNFQVELKDDQSPVTIADRESEQLLRTTLKASFPRDGFLGEEYGDEPGTSGFRWIIDPIDGTRNFVRAIPIWATLVGLEHQGETIAGVIFAPALGQLWRALRGDGAFCNDRPIRVSDRTRLEDATIFYTSMSWFERAGKGADFLELIRRTQVQRGFGDFFGHVLVAQGSGEVMVEHGVHVWDVAAIKPIVEEAGGRFSDWTGAPRIDRPDVLISNGRLHDEVLRILAGQRS